MSIPNRPVAVSVHRDGFRRAGRVWTVQPQRVRVVPDAAGEGEITADQLLELEGDPNVAVVPVADAAEAAAAEAAAAEDATAAARAAHLRTATRLAPEGAERTQAGQLTTAWLESATGLDGVTAAERDAAAEDAGAAEAV